MNRRLTIPIPAIAFVCALLVPPALLISTPATAGIGNPIKKAKEKLDEERDGSRPRRGNPAERSHRRDPRTTDATGGAGRRRGDRAVRIGAVVSTER